MTLPDLIERLEHAKGHDRSIDVEIMNALCPREEGEEVLFMDKLLKSRWGAFGQPSDKIEYFIEAPKLTESFDAAVDLAEKVLNIYSLNLVMDPSGCSAKIVYWPAGLSGGIEIRSEGMGWTPVNSIVIAILKAKQQSGE